MRLHCSRYFAREISGMGFPWISLAAGPQSGNGRRSPLGAIAALGGLLAASLAAPSPGWAADRIVLEYGSLQGTIETADLEALVDRGEVSPVLAGYLLLARQQPEVLREVLTREVAIPGNLVSRALESSWGGGLLDRLGGTIRAASGTADRGALREALVRSAADDRLGLLEVLQNYPTSEIRVDGNRLMDAYRQVSRMKDQIEIFGDRLDRVLDDVWDWLD